jgi:hypothetical protein
LTDQLVTRLNRELPTLGADVATVAWQWLTLLDDEQHYAAALTGPLAHGRLYRPERVTWQNPIHEHQSYVGRRLDWPEYMLHCRQLFAERCRRQTGFPPSAWPNCVESKRPITELGAPVTWSPLTWPEEERRGTLCID